MSVEVSIILRCIRPHLSDETVPVLQKRVYFCLLRICHYHAPFIVTTMLAGFSSLLMKSILTLNIVSKRYRSQVPLLRLQGTLGAKPRTHPVLHVPAPRSHSLPEGRFQEGPRHLL